MSKPKLLDQVRSTIRFRHFNIRTEQIYIHWIKRFILFHNKRHPLDIGEDEIRQFLSYLATTENVASSTQNVALSSILFLFRHVLRQEMPFINGIERSKRSAKIPLVFTLTLSRFLPPNGKPAIWLWTTFDGMSAIAS